MTINKRKIDRIVIQFTDQLREELKQMKNLEPGDTLRMHIKIVASFDRDDFIETVRIPLYNDRVGSWENYLEYVATLNDPERR